MLPPAFKTARKLANKVDAYFRYIKGEYHTGIKSGKQKIHTQEPEPATMAGFALFIGFDSLPELDDYEQNGEFGKVISRGRLKVAAVYEKRLHDRSPSGALFALKNLCSKEKSDGRLKNEIKINTLQVAMVVTGPRIAGNEAEVEI